MVFSVHITPLKRAIAVEICLFVRHLSLELCIMTKRNNLLSTFYTIWKIDASRFPTRSMADLGWPVLPDILGQSDPSLRKRRFKIDFCSQHLSHTQKS